MKRFIVFGFVLLCIMTQIMAQTKTVYIKIIATTDVHGCFLAYDFINDKPLKGSMARVSSYVNKMRAEYDDNLILIDNGDILQGQPTCYYYNYIKTDCPNIASDVLNYLRYDAVVPGNHDIETGHPVYDKWINELRCPAIAANIIDTKTNKPYIKPYIILEREGVKIAVFGMISPAIPSWLNEKLWHGLRFEGIYDSSKRWIKHIKEVEHADVIIGVFHSGWNNGIVTDDYSENETERIAREIPGFDAIIFGHDHIKRAASISTQSGNVVCVNPSSNALAVGQLSVDVTFNGTNIVSKDIAGDVIDITQEPIDPDFSKTFQPHSDSIEAYAKREIGTIDQAISSKDCFFGSAAFVDLIHNLQLRITNADISLCAPLSFNTTIEAGSITVSDMFKLYKYENQLCVLTLTGREIRNHLEMSYGLWTNTMTSKTDHIILLNDDRNVEDTHKYGFKNQTFNFDSAAGIDYEVDVTQPMGKKVRILRMSNGQPFVEDKTYRVVTNSYRANGGGELLTTGAGIPKDSLAKRIIYQSELDQRHYLMKEIERMGTISPKANDNWRFVPEAWATEAIKRDKAIIFNK